MPIITKSLSVEELPPPPLGKTGWAWTEHSEPLPSRMSNGSEWPCITIVTPNYNYGQFLEETIRSVLLQGYPNLEYIILDGGSTDNSVEIIKKYEKWLAYWVSEKDNGQANAINKGIDLANGIWFNWLNSDDILLPNSLRTLAEITQIATEAQWITGARIDIDIDGRIVDICVPWRTDPTIIGLDTVNFPQDATFIKLSFLKDNKIKLFEEFNNIFDTILYLRLSQLEKPILTTSIFSAMRWHKGQKTLNQKISSEEYFKGILPIFKKFPLGKRILLRLLRTRFHYLIRLVLHLMIFYNLIPASSKWQVVYFHYQNCALQKVPARLAMMR